MCVCGVRVIVCVEGGGGGGAGECVCVCGGCVCVCKDMGGVGGGRWGRMGAQTCGWEGWVSGS